MREREAFQEETASLEEAACYQWEEEGTEVSAEKKKDRPSIRLSCCKENGCGSK